MDDPRSTYGLPAWLLAEVTGTHKDTARRWKRAGLVPRHFADLVQLRIHGDLGVLSPAWKGFRLRNDHIWTPEDQPVKFGELRAIPYNRELIRELQHQLEQPQQRNLF